MVEKVAAQSKPGIAIINDNNRSSGDNNNSNNSGGNANLINCNISIAASDPSAECMHVARWDDLGANGEVRDDLVMVGEEACELKARQRLSTERRG